MRIREQTAVMCLALLCAAQPLAAQRRGMQAGASYDRGGFGGMPALPTRGIAQPSVTGWSFGGADGASLTRAYAVVNRPVNFGDVDSHNGYYRQNMGCCYSEARGTVGALSDVGATRAGTAAGPSRRRARLCGRSRSPEVESPKTLSQ